MSNAANPASPAPRVRTFWETVRPSAGKAAGKRLVREHLDAAGRVVRFEVVAVAR